MSELVAFLASDRSKHISCTEIWIDGVANRVKADDGIVVPQGARHNVVSVGVEPLRLYTIYGPPEHLDGVTQRTKADADSAAHNDGDYRRKPADLKGEPGND